MAEHSTNLSGRSLPANRSSRLLLAIGILWLILAAGLLAYEFAAPPRVEITWTTATEQQTVGFNLHRSTSSDSDFQLVNIDQLIASQGSPISGATYSYIDTSVEAGDTYYYLLEEVESDASLNRYDEDVFTYHVPFVTWWLIVMAVVSLVVGLVLILAGLKEKRIQ